MALSMKLYRKITRLLIPAISTVFLLFLFLGCPPVHADVDSTDPGIDSSLESTTADKQAEETGHVQVATADKPSEDEYGDVTEEEISHALVAKGEKSSDEYGDVTEEEISHALVAKGEKSSDEYGDVTEEEARESDGPGIADPIEPFNRGIHHFNDKVYFWVWKPLAHGYKYVVPEGIRGIFSSFYENIKAPIRIINNLLQGEPKFAAIELAKFFINSTLGVGGLRDCAKECFGIEGRHADFGQTLGKYGVGFGFYLVIPFLGPSSPRDGIGWLADWTLRPTTYVSTEWFSAESVGLYVHEKVNDTSFHLGEYEMIKEAAIDPYLAVRDAYVQYRMKLIER